MSQHSDQEARTGWFRSAGNQLRMNLWYESEPALTSWLGALAITLCVLSWWNEQTVPATVMWIASCVRGLFV